MQDLRTACSREEDDVCAASEQDLRRGTVLSQVEVVRAPVPVRVVRSDEDGDHVFPDRRIEQQGGRGVREAPDRGDEDVVVCGAAGFDDRAGGGIVDRRFPVRKVAVRAAVCGNPAPGQGQIADPDELFIGFCHAVAGGGRILVPERRRAESEDLEVGIQQRIRDGELVVDLVGRVGIEKEFLRPRLGDAGEDGGAVFTCHDVLLSFRRAEAAPGIPMDDRFRKTGGCVRYSSKNTVPTDHAFTFGTVTSTVPG